jgi:hypothetical protein
MKTHPEPAALVALALLLTGCPQGSADDTGCDGLGWVEGTIVDLDGEPLLDADLTARSDLQDDIAVTVAADGSFGLALEPGYWVFSGVDSEAGARCEDGALHPRADVIVLYCGEHSIALATECDDVD